MAEHEPASGRALSVLRRGILIPYKASIAYAHKQFRAGQVDSNNPDNCKVYYRQVMPGASRPHGANRFDNYQTYFYPLAPTPAWANVNLIIIRLSIEQ